MTEFFNPEAFSPSGKANKKFVSAVVVAPNGEVLCQLRDDIPGIIHPGCWTSSPGGTVEQGESTLDAVSHEMLEEFNVQIVDVEPLTSFELEGEFAGEYYIFSTKLASPLEDVCCNEGDPTPEK